MQLDYLDMRFISATWFIYLLLNLETVTGQQGLGVRPRNLKLLYLRRPRLIPPQVGNAVPPPLSRAIGLEIKKCILERIKEEGVQGDSHSFLLLIQWSSRRNIPFFTGTLTVFLSLQQRTWNRSRWRLSINFPPPRWIPFLSSWRQSPPLGLSVLIFRLASSRVTGYFGHSVQFHSMKSSSF